MTQKANLKELNAKIDEMNQASRVNPITEETTKAYMDFLAEVYDYESETLYKRDNPMRYIK
jgi:hypothetical protein